MTWTYDVQTLFDGDRRHVVKVVGLSDGADDDVGTAVDISTLTGPNGEAVDRLSIQSVEYSSTVAFRLAFDHTANDEIAYMPADSGYLSWEKYGGFTDPASAGGTGDVLITPVGSAADKQMTLTIDCIKKI